MRTENTPPRWALWVWPTLLAAALIGLWQVLSALGILPAAVVPSPLEVAQALGEEIAAGRLLNDTIASLFRMGCGFVLAAVLGIPLGLWLGLRPGARATLLPGINFFRSLSPLAWIPFAILWFGIGDGASIFLIFMACFFPVAMATLAAVANIPAVYFRVADEYGLRGGALLWEVTLPAILPQVITTLRLTVGLAWLVVVAAEMIVRQDGLGSLIWDARDGLRMDLLVAAMIVIGTIGVLLDRVMLRLTLLPQVRWGYEH